MADRFLLADVGGTHTRVGLGGPAGLEADTVQTVRNSDHSGLIPLLQSYRLQHPGPVSAICAGVAGPVDQQTAQMTNLDWFIDAQEIRTALGVAHARLINDLQAQGRALDDIAPANITCLFPGAPAPPGATRLVIGLGTGFNIAVVHRTPDGLLVPPSETGHTSLPHMDGDAGRLIAHLAETQYHKPVEAALSGPGLARIFRYISGDTLAAPDIIRCHEREDIEATATLTLFTEILGAITGNIALAHLPMGGIYFIGGLARAVAPSLDGLRFRDHFTAKGPYTPVLQDIPIFLIDDDTAALHGCNRCLIQHRSDG